MVKLYIFFALLVSYLLYSLLVYTKGTATVQPAPASTLALQGKAVFQQYNCISCHQVYGLGGYLGTDLTHAWTDPSRGPLYMKALLESGSARMPRFVFKDGEKEALLAYLAFLDNGSTAIK